MKPSTIALALAALCSGSAYAFAPLVTDDTGTQGAGGNQLETGYLRSVDRSPKAGVVSHEIPFAYTRGLRENLDIYVSRSAQRIVPGVPEEVASGWSSISVGSKWRFHENGSGKTSFAMKPEIQLPVTPSAESRGLGSARASYSIGLLISRETRFGSVHANLIAARVQYADAALNVAERRTRYRLSVAPVWDAAKRWKLALDAGLMTNPDRSAGARIGYLEFGLVYSPHDTLDLALGIVRNNGDASATQTSATIAWRF